jgi:hypothetical protein
LFLNMTNLPTIARNKPEAHSTTRRQDEETRHAQALQLRIPVSAFACTPKTQNNGHVRSCVDKQLQLKQVAHVNLLRTRVTPMSSNMRPQQ